MLVAGSRDFTNAAEIKHNNYELFTNRQVSVGSKTYVKITGLEHSKDNTDFRHRKEAGYTFKTSFITGKDATRPTHIFAAGNGGSLDYIHNKDTEYIIEYSPMIITDPEEAKKIATDYHFYYTILSSTNKHNLEREAKCGSFYASSHGNRTEWHSHSSCTPMADTCSIRVDFSKIDQNFKTHYLTITGWGVHKDSHQSAHVNYQVIEFDIEPSVMRTIVKTPWWAKLLAVCVIALVVIVVLLMRRATTLKQKLDYEMNDVRNVAGGMPSIPGVGNSTSLTGGDKHMFQEMTEKL